MKRGTTHTHNFVNGFCVGCGALADGNDGLPSGPDRQPSHLDRQLTHMLETGKIYTIDPATDIVVLSCQDNLPPKALARLVGQVRGLWEKGRSPKVIVLDGGMTFDVYRKQSEADEDLVEITSRDQLVGPTDEVSE